MKFEVQMDKLSIVSKTNIESWGLHTTGNSSAAFTSLLIRQSKKPPWKTQANQFLAILNQASYHNTDPVSKYPGPNLSIIFEVDTLENC